MKKNMFYMPVLAAILAGTSACTEIDKYTNLPPLSLDSRTEIDSYNSATIYTALQYPAFYEIVHLSYWSYEQDDKPTTVTDIIPDEEKGHFIISLSDLTPETLYFYNFTVDCADGSRLYTEPCEFTTPTDVAEIKFEPFKVVLYEGAKPYLYNDPNSQFCTVLNGTVDDNKYDRYIYPDFFTHSEIYWHAGQMASFTVASSHNTHQEPPYYPKRIYVNDDLLFTEALLGHNKAVYPEKADITLTGRMAYIRLTVNSNIDERCYINIETAGTQTPGMVTSALFGLDGNFTEPEYGYGQCARKDYRENDAYIAPYAKNRQLMYAAIPQSFADGCAQFRICSWTSDFKVILPIPGGTWKSHQIHDYAIDITGTDEATLSIDGIVIEKWKNGASENISPEL